MTDVELAELTEQMYARILWIQITRQMDSFTGKLTLKNLETYTFKKLQSAIFILSSDLASLQMRKA